VAVGSIPRLVGIGLAVLLSTLAASAPWADPLIWSPSPGPVVGVHEGVASCSASTCHGRQVASGLVVRQNELVTWQDPSTPAGAHSRAFRALTGSRGEAIARRLGLGPAQHAPACLGCHVDPAPPGMRGAKFQAEDGVGCEACHGGSGGWLANHYAVGASHAGNVAAGLRQLDSPTVRAGVCLDCHFGSAKYGQFVSHQLMSAGHPRLSFELDLFTELQRHHDVTPAYVARGKIVAGGVKVWALGQAIALQRSLGLYGSPKLGQSGSFPEFYFFDCHSCHRAISDEKTARPAFVLNPARPIPSGMPPFNDENMILLTAAAEATSPQLAERFAADALAFHRGLATDRASAVAAAGELARTAHALEASFGAHGFTRAETLAILGHVLGDAMSARYTDYEGGVQAVMAIDTLLNAMVASGQIDRSAAAAMRPDINRAYQAVRDPNAFRPFAFREALGRIAADIRTLS
jgi:hypothetical protein